MEIIIECKLLSHILEYLQPEHHETLQYEACWTVINIASSEWTMQLV